MRSRIAIAAVAVFAAAGVLVAVAASTSSEASVDHCPGHNSSSNIKVETGGSVGTTLTEDNADPRLETGGSFCAKAGTANSGVQTWTGEFSMLQDISYYVIYPPNGGTTTTVEETTTTVEETTTTLEETTTTLEETTTTVEETTTTTATTVPRDIATTTTPRDIETTTTVVDTTVPRDEPNQPDIPNGGPERDLPLPENPQPREGQPRLPATGVAPWALLGAAVAVLGIGAAARQFARRDNEYDDLRIVEQSPLGDDHHDVR